MVSPLAMDEDTRERNSTVPKVTFVAIDGSQRTLDAAVGESVMATAVKNGVSGIVGECGGNRSCATCHVYVAEDFLPDLRPVLLRDDFHRHLAGPEAVHLDRARQVLQPRVDLAIDVGHGESDAQAPLERPQVFQICLHQRPCTLNCLVRKEGLEPTRLSAPEPKSGASTNSATFAVTATPLDSSGNASY